MHKRESSQWDVQPMWTAGFHSLSRSTMSRRAICDRPGTSAPTLVCLLAQHSERGFQDSVAVGGEIAVSAAWVRYLSPVSGFVYTTKLWVRR